MLKIIDLKVSNIASVVKAFKYLQQEFEVIESPEQLDDASKILLPGVGSFANAAARLEQTGFLQEIPAKVVDEGVPILGICIGMHLLADAGSEAGGGNGLGLIKGTVERLAPSDPSIRIPHAGWNNLITEPSKQSSLLNNTTEDSCFYFVHSYHFDVVDEQACVTMSNHGDPFVAYVEKGNIYGAQFHPEKSQAEGLNFLKAFANIC